MTAASALLGAVLALSVVSSAPAQSEHPAAPAGSTHASPPPAYAEGAAPEHAPAASHGGDEEHGPAAILMHHVVDVRWGHLFVGPIDLGPTKHLAFFAAAALIVLVVIRLSLRGYRPGGVPTGLAAVVETLVVFVRDEIAEKNIGHDGHKHVPLLCSFFFFILTAALLGLMPFSATSTGNVSVTLGLAIISFVATQMAGIQKFGVVHHFVGMIPPGLPKFLVPIMIPVELLGMFARPFALTVRLFANMVAGHMVITTLLLLIPLMATVSQALGIMMIPVSLGLGLFIMFLELLVAFLQAFIFTLLTAIFIGMAAHPAH